MSTAPSDSADLSQRLVCNICNKRFSRLEHRRRHEQIHAGEKSYRCNYCEKTFGRRDAAKRHKHAHETVLLPPSLPLVTLRGSCSACSRSRVKCPRGKPCANCTAKKLICTYENRKRRRTIYDETDHSQCPSSSEREIFCRNDRPRMSFTPTTGHSSGASNVESAPESLLMREESAHGQYDEDLPRPSNDSRLDAQTYEGRIDAPSSSSQARSNEESSTRELDPLLVSLMETNWLPFDQSVTNGIDHSIVGNHAARWNPPTVQGSSMSIMDDNELNANHFISTESEKVYSLNDTVSALITSMKPGLPGLPLDLIESDVPREGLREMGLVSLYSDGAGARTSQSDRRIYERQKSYSTHGEVRDESGNSVPSWRAILRSKLLQNQSRMHFSVPDDVYKDAYNRITREWTDTAFYPLVSEDKNRLLNKETLELFIQLYFENFHSVYPFLDRSLICIPVWGWSLCLAAAAIGARYLDIPEITDFGDGICSLLNEILFKELGFGNMEDSLPYIQARILAAIGLCHSRHSSLMNCGYNVAGLVFNSCLRLRLLEEDDRIGTFQQGEDNERMWIAWRFRETRRRTSFFIYVADCMLAYKTRTPPRLPLKLLKLIVPSSDGLWESDTCEKWYLNRTKGDGGDFDFEEEERSRPQIRDVLREVWTSLHPPESLTDFGTISLIHVLVRRVWDAPWYMENPSASWPQCQPSEGIIPVGYHAELDAFLKWRNGTCDCLDALHWNALSLSAKSGGLEGPIFLQLHLARLLLLTPFRQLFSHVQTSQRSPSDCRLPHDLYYGSEPDHECRQAIASWVKRDRHKARLAVIHAGAIFWHVRRYSSDCFAQSFAVFLAAIVLWAYGKFYCLSISATQTRDDPSLTTVHAHEGPEPTETSQNVSSISPSTSVNSSSSLNADATVISAVSPGVTNRPRMPNFMQLDRPMDDELVQHFIRAGEGITLYLEGVHNLCSDQGTVQVLREAILILSESKDIWSISENYIECLHGVLGS